MQSMSDEPAGAPPTGRYEIRVRGRVSDSLLGQFEALKASTEPVETVIHGDLRDSAELFALLARIELLGLELLGVHKCAPGGSSDREQPSGMRPMTAVPTHKSRRIK